jgi:uncharacterized protein YceK
MITHAMTIVKKLNKLSVIVTIMLSILITGCSSVQTPTEKTSSDYKAVKTSTDYRKVWSACIDSLSDIQLAAISTDSASGLITAGQTASDKKAPVPRLNIRISSDAKNTFVAVESGTAEDNGTVDRFLKALKQRIPNLEPVIINSSGKTVK